MQNLENVRNQTEVFGWLVAKLEIVDFLRNNEMQHDFDYKRYCDLLLTTLDQILPFCPDVSKADAEAFIRFCIKHNNKVEIAHDESYS